MQDTIEAQGDVGTAAFDPTDFGSLQSQKWHARLRAAASAMGIDIPFFRAHEGRAGAETRIGGRQLINFASYDYLGLNQHPDVSRAAIAAIERYGTSVSASRLIAGERPFHSSLEQLLADMHGVEGALSLVSGHATNVTTIGHLLGPRDLLIYDSSIHNSAILGGRLSHTTVLKFPHNNLDALQRLLEQHRISHRRCLIAVEGLYSMEGDIADLPALIKLKRDHKSWLMVDEAHAVGVLGATGRGSSEHFGLKGPEVDIWMGTLSKALASTGGYVAGNEQFIDYMKHSAPGFVFSVGLPPAAAAAAETAIGLMRRESDRVSRLQHRTQRLKQGLESVGFGCDKCYGSAILPVTVGDSALAMIWAELLFREGINVMPILFPAVAPDGALLRFFVSSEHTEQQIDYTISKMSPNYAKACELVAETGTQRHEFPRN